MELADEVLDLGPGPVASPRIRGWNVHSPPTTTARANPYTMGLGERLRTRWPHLNLPRSPNAGRGPRQGGEDEARVVAVVRWFAPRSGRNLESITRRRRKASGAAGSGPRTTLICVEL
jgi:hypothetical protein